VTDRQTDRRTDGRAIEYARYIIMLSRAKSHVVADVRKMKDSGCYLNKVIVQSLICGLYCTLRIRQLGIQEQRWEDFGGFRNVDMGAECFESADLWCQCHFHCQTMHRRIEQD